MDWVNASSKAVDFLKKYRYMLLILILGIFLMMLPEGTNEIPDDSEPAEIQEADLETKLEDILSKIEGAGKVHVLLTQSAGEQTVYQIDEDVTDSMDSSDIRRETVIIMNADREENGLVQRVNAPIYQGAVVVCQGANSAAIRLAIVEAVSKVTGLSSNQISVLKMK